jgi:uncharacterized protein with HEPN domain
MTKDDLVYVGHMLDTTALALRKIRGKTREQFDADEDLRIIAAHLIQIIGEAARRVSSRMRADHPDIPWDQIVGIRHRIVHDYMDLDEDVIWEVLVGDLPRLHDMLARIVPPEP